MAQPDNTYWQRFFNTYRRAAPKQMFQWKLEPGSGTCTLTLHSNGGDEGDPPGSDPLDITEAVCGVAQFQASGGDELVQIVDDANILAAYPVFYAKIVLATGGADDADYSGGRFADWTD